MADRSTDLGGSARPFPPTRWTLLHGAADPALFHDSLGHLARLYWRPVYAYLRRKWNRSNEEAKDLTQEFFLALSEKDIFQTLSPERGRFRSYVRAALDNFVRMSHRSDQALKRGGAARRFSLSDQKGFEPSADLPPDEAFLREWARTVLTEAAREMEEEFRTAGKEKAFEMFRLRDLDPPAEGSLDYETLAKRFGVGLSDASVTVFRARQRLRELVLERVRDTVTSEEEAQAELREIFGKRGR